jgi:hypothetical protein
MKFDVAFDFTSDTPNYWDNFWNDSILGGGSADPDAVSKTLQAYHQFLWSKPLPNGEQLCLEKGTGYNYLTWKDFRWGMLVCHQSFYVRMDLAKQELYNLRYHFSADFDWCIRLMKQANNSIYNSQMILTDYLHEGMTTTYHKSSLWERFKIMANHYGLTATILQHFYFIIRLFTKK